MLPGNACKSFPSSWQDVRQGREYSVELFPLTASLSCQPCDASQVTTLVSGQVRLPLGQGDFSSFDRRQGGLSFPRGLPSVCGPPKDRARHLPDVALRLGHRRARILFAPSLDVKRGHPTLALRAALPSRAPPPPPPCGRFGSRLNALGGERSRPGRSPLCPRKFFVFFRSTPPILVAHDGSGCGRGLMSPRRRWTGSRLVPGGRILFFSSGVDVPHRDVNRRAAQMFSTLGKAAGDPMDISAAVSEGRGGLTGVGAGDNQPSPAQPSPAQPSPAQPSPAQPSPAQPSPAQPSPAQPSPAQPSPAARGVQP